MRITTTINIVEVVWFVVALFGLFYGIKVRQDAVTDVAVRHAAGVNSGRQELAQLLVATSSLLCFAFAVWLLCGLLAMMVPSPPSTTPLSYVIQFGLVAAEVALAYMLFHKQTVRRRVLIRDMASDAVLHRAAADLLRMEQRANTEALIANTTATEAATHALQNGPMAAQVAQTEATTDLTAATTENTDVIRISTEVELKKLSEDSHE